MADIQTPSTIYKVVGLISWVFLSAVIVWVWWYVPPARLASIVIPQSYMVMIVLFASWSGTLLYACTGHFRRAVLVGVCVGWLVFMQLQRTLGFAAAIVIITLCIVLEVGLTLLQRK